MPWPTRCGGVCRPPRARAPIPGASRNALTCIGHVGDAEIRRIFDDGQWPAAEQKLKELKQVAARLQRN